MPEDQFDNGLAAVSAGDHLGSSAKRFAASGGLECNDGATAVGLVETEPAPLGNRGPARKPIGLGLGGSTGLAGISHRAPAACGNRAVLYQTPSVRRASRYSQLYP
jgi:hypothetical protein